MGTAEKQSLFCHLFKAISSDGSDVAVWFSGLISKAGISGGFQVSDIFNIHSTLKLEGYSGEIQL